MGARLRQLSVTGATPGFCCATPDFVRVVTKWRFLFVCINCEHVGVDEEVLPKDRDWMYFTPDVEADTSVVDA